MNEPSKKIEAQQMFARAYATQMEGNLDRAIELYTQSLELEPSAEAHTFLGWTYSMLGRYEEAITECKLAIELDPEFGNPWNDIGAYLIEIGREDEAIPYLERATRAKRYESFCFPHFNLSRVFYKKGMMHKATEELKKALEANPNYLPALEALTTVEAQIH